MKEEPNAHFWKDQDTFHCLLFVGEFPPHTSIEFRAPSWRKLKKVMREHGYETTLREGEVAEQWRMPSGDMFVGVR